MTDENLDAVISKLTLLRGVSRAASIYSQTLEALAVVRCEIWCDRAARALSVTQDCVTVAVASAGHRAVARVYRVLIETEEARALAVNPSREVFRSNELVVEIDRRSINCEFDDWSISDWSTGQICASHITKLLLVAAGD